MSHWIRRLRLERRKDRKEFGVAFLISLLVHLLALLFFVFSILVWPENFFPSNPEKIEDLPVEVTILPPPPPKEQAMTFIETNAEESSVAPENARFESDRNTLAASEISGKGPQDIPTLEGRDATYLELENQQSSLGPEKQPQPATPPQPENKPEPPLPEKPQPKKEEPQPEKKEPPKKEEAKPEKPKPPTHAPELSALRKPQDVRRADPVAPPEVKQQVRRAEEANPQQARPPGYQPERRITRIEGGVSNQGRSSVAAMSTPIGRYKKALSDAIGSRWYFYVRNEIGVLSVGTLTIRFEVSVAGKVSKVKVLSNSSNESFASVSIRSIMEANIPPIPPDVAELLENNRIEVDYTFSILAN